jgi:ABC-2 type transport system permease protein
VESLDDEVFVRVYLQADDLPAGFERLASATRDMLEELNAASGGKVKYQFVEPGAGLTDSAKGQVFRDLYEQGLEPTDLTVKAEGGGMQNQIIWPGAMVAYKGREAPAQLLLNRPGVPPEVSLNSSEENLEYAFANALRRIRKSVKPKVGVVIGHGEASQEELAELQQAMGEMYDVLRIDTRDQFKIDTSFKALIIARPRKPFSEQEKFILDQYMVRGGRILLMADRLGASLDSLAASQSEAFLAFDNPLNLDDLLFRWGLRLNDNLVQDLRCQRIPVVTGESGGQPVTKLLEWPYYPLLIPTTNHPIGRSLDNVGVQFAGTIDTVKAPGLQKTILLATSPYSKALFNPVRVSLALIRAKQDPKTYNQGRQPLAVLSEGVFTSTFTSRKTPAMLRTMDSLGAPFLDKTGKAGAVLVISDGDFGLNRVGRESGRAYPMGSNPFTKEVYANRQFLLNAVDYLADDGGLISVRAKRIELRLLDKTAVKQTRSAWQTINVAGPVALVLVLVGAFSMWRRRRYAR